MSSTGHDRPPRGRRRFAATAAVIGVATAAALASAPSAMANVPSWTIQTTPTPGGTLASDLEAVSCPSATACLAVGFNRQPGHVFFATAESWDGTNWTIVTPAKPPTAAVTDLPAVSCTSATACTAVGFYRDGSGVTYPLAERWNGTGWTIQTPQTPAGTTTASLAGVSCPTATTCVAVGSAVNSDTGTAEDLAESWDGNGWTVRPTHAAFRKIDYLLQAVSCSSASDCLAVGQYDSRLGGADRYATWAEHWDGTSWTGELPDVASSSSNDLLGVSCTSATACTAVGYEVDPSGTYFPLAERWNGTSWALQSPEFPPTASVTALNAVSCASATACMAVGVALLPDFTPNLRVTLAESWDGSTWTLGNAANPLGAGQNSLDGVSCLSATVCTAVGWSDKSSSPTTPLAERSS